MELRGCTTNAVRMRKRTGSALTFAMAMLSVFAVPVAQAQNADIPVLFIEAASGAVGTDIATDVILFVSPGKSASAFRATVQFDQPALTFARIEFGSAMSSNSAHVPSDGNLVIELSGGNGCPTGSSCFLATIHWTAHRTGDYQLHIVDASATDGSAVLDVRTSDAKVTVTEPELTPDSRDSDLGLVNTAILGAIVLLLCGVLTAPVVFFARRLRAGRPPSAAAPTARIDEEQLAGYVGRYLDDIQAAGAADEPLTEADAMARAHANEDV